MIDIRRSLQASTIFGFVEVSAELCPEISHLGLRFHQITFKDVRKAARLKSLRKLNLEAGSRSFH